MSPHIAYCGTDCENCEAYKATKLNSDIERIRIAKEWSDAYKADIRPEQVNCEGCKTPEGRPMFFYCEECDMRLCAMEQDIPHCAACVDYPCEELEEAFKVAPELKANLDALKESN